MKGTAMIRAPHSPAPHLVEPTLDMLEILNSGGRALPGRPFASTTAGMTPTLTGPIVMPPSGHDPQPLVILILILILIHGYGSNGDDLRNSRPSSSKRKRLSNTEAVSKLAPAATDLNDCRNRLSCG
jgi:hypothetical protein